MSADSSDVIAIQKRLKSASTELNNPASVSLYAHARTVIGYDSERRKNLLARYTVRYMKQDHDGRLSYTAAEAIARADEAYQIEFQTQAEELQTAEAVVAKRRGTETSWETARSLLSFERQMAREIPATEA